METARPCAPETRSRDRLWFGFRPDKLGKRPGFTDSTGEYRDTRDWLAEEPVSSEPVSAADSLLTGKITGNFAKSGPIAAPSPEKPPLQQWLRGKFPTHP